MTIEITIKEKSKYLKSDLLAECLANNDMPHASFHKIKPHLTIENVDKGECWMFEKFLPPLRLWYIFQQMQKRHFNGIPNYDEGVYQFLFTFMKEASSIMHWQSLIFDNKPVFLLLHKSF